MRIITVSTLAILACVLSDGLTARPADACGVKLTVKAKRGKQRQVGAKEGSEPIAASAGTARRPKAAGTGRTPVRTGPEDRADVPARTGGDTVARADQPRRQPPREPEPAPTPAVEETQPAPEPVATTEPKPRKPKREKAAEPDETPEPSDDSAPGIDVVVYFGSNQTRADDDASLQEAVDWLNANKGGRLVVIGHADAAGPDSYNLTLSRRRAVSVRNQLVRKTGVSAKRIRVVAKGESELADPNDDSKNRRVEIRKR